MENTGDPPKGPPKASSPDEVPGTPPGTHEHADQPPREAAPPSAKPDAPSTPRKGSVDEEMDNENPPSSSTPTFTPEKSFSDAAQTKSNRGSNTDPRKSATSKGKTNNKKAPPPVNHEIDIFETATTMKPMAANQYRVVGLNDSPIHEIPPQVVKEAFNLAKEEDRIKFMDSARNKTSHGFYFDQDKEVPTPSKLESLEAYNDWVQAETLRSVFIELYPNQKSMYYPHLFLDNKYPTEEHDQIVDTMINSLDQYMAGRIFPVKYQTPDGSEC